MLVHKSQVVGDPAVGEWVIVTWDDQDIYLEAKRPNAPVFDLEKLEAHSALSRAI